MLVALVLIIATAVLVAAVLHVVNKFNALFNDESMATINATFDRMRESVENSTLK